MSIKQHLQNKSHRENVIKKKSLVKQRDTSNIEESVGKMLTKNTVDSYSYRRLVCKALLIAGISFQFLEIKDSCTLRHLLEDGGGATLPRRDVVDIIPSVLAEEINNIIQELGSKNFSIIFDGTTAVAEVFGLVIRFVNKDHIISHRALSIRFYGESFKKEHLASEIVKIISTQHGIDLNRVLFAVCDGCPTNGAALSTINQLQPCLLGQICISHAANVVGSVLKCECQIAEKFLSHWSAMINSCPRMRSLFKTLTNESIKKPSAVRWFVWFEMAKQIHYTFPSVEAIINHEDDFCPETRNKLRFILEEYYADLRLEIALIIDIERDGDGFLAPTSYDPGSLGFCRERREKIIPFYQKMVYDSDGRMYETL